ncbi:hypothetical protein C6569_00170 [Phreatobacter cathodiphilus]|uniref:Uncharacterized protein n=2 Tax=Phreatobacter cathodiphilus TaxID=1868589 RepID=A0A2S0N648_9HYPH|nr:hypothetical protein C6569_00170 [Phreatobacter cathodiphilus]
MGRIWEAVWPAGAGGRTIASLRDIDPRISPDFDFHLRRDDGGVFFVDGRGKRVAHERVEALADGIDGLLRHIRDAGETIPTDKTPFRSLWTGEAFAVPDLQLSGATIDVNLSRRAGLIEIDVPVATSENPLTLTPEALNNFVTAIRRLLARGVVDEGAVA